MIQYSFALKCFCPMPLVSSTSSYGKPNIFICIFLSTWSTFCSARMREIALIPLIEYDVLCPPMHVLKYGTESRVNVLRWLIAFGSSSQCIKIWNDSFSALCDKFRHYGIFSKNLFLGHPRPPVCIIITAADIYYACGYCFDLMLCKKIV